MISAKAYAHFYFVSDGKLAIKNYQTGEEEEIVAHFFLRNGTVLAVTESTIMTVSNREKRLKTKFSAGIMSDTFLCNVFEDLKIHRVSFVFRDQNGHIRFSRYPSIMKKSNNGISLYCFYPAA